MKFNFLGYIVSIDKRQFTEFTKVLIQKKDIYKYAKKVSKWEFEWNEEIEAYYIIPQIKNIRFKWGFSLKTAKDVVNMAIEIKEGIFKKNF